MKDSWIELFCDDNAEMVMYHLLHLQIQDFLDILHCQFIRIEFYETNIA